MRPSSNRTSILLSIACLVAMPLLTACSLTITQGNPRPNIALTPKQTSMTLVLGKAVADSFEVPNENGIMGGHVESWHATLASGFKNGFGDAYKLAPAGSPVDATLALDEVDLEFVPAAVNGAGGVVAAAAQVRFKATLLDGSGAIVRRAAGTAVSKKVTANRGEATNLAVSAIETMYEQIAKELLSDAAPAK